jgi:hypothetical protein
MIEEIERRLTNADEVINEDQDMSRIAQQKLQQLDHEPVEITTSASNMDVCSDAKEAPAKDTQILEEGAGARCENLEAACSVEPSRLPEPSPARRRIKSFSPFLFTSAQYYIVWQIIALNRRVTRIPALRQAPFSP